MDAAGAGAACFVRMFHVQQRNTTGLAWRCFKDNSSNKKSFRNFTIHKIRFIQFYFTLGCFQFAYNISSGWFFFLLDTVVAVAFATDFCCCNQRQHQHSIVCVAFIVISSCLYNMIYFFWLRWYFIMIKFSACLTVCALVVDEY